MSSDKNPLLFLSFHLYSNGGHRYEYKLLVTRKIRGKGVAGLGQILLESCVLDLSDFCSSDPLPRKTVGAQVFKTVLPQHRMKSFRSPFKDVAVFTFQYTSTRTHVYTIQNTQFLSAGS